MEMLGMALDAHDALRDAGREDLDHVRRELARMNGLLGAVLRRGGAVQSAEFRDLLPRIRGYLDGYDFAREIDAMSGLYSGDAGRVRGIRLKILEALGERGLVEDARRACGR